MIIKTTSKILNKLRDVEELVFSLIGAWILKRLGVKIGNQISLIGLPSLNMAKGSFIKIGNNCTLRSRSRNNAIGINHKIILRTQEADSVIKIGNHTGISGGAICSKKSVIIGDNCLIGSNVIIADNDFHAVKPENRVYNRNSTDIPAKPVTIKNNVWIGADSYILKGVTIGENSVIGAMSVVTKDVPVNEIWAGNPATKIKDL